jgi:glycosyltransferase involved in cell wall biosynthesis
MTTRLSVVLPVYNEAPTVAEILDQVTTIQIPDVEIEVIVVESNSTDGSRQICQRYADHPRVKLVLQERPAGKGNAVRAGLAQATGDIILIQDGDLEYQVDEYPVVLAPLIAGETNFVLGCRHTPGRPMRLFEESRHASWVMNGAHWAFTTLFNVVYRTKLRDPFTMYKVFRTACVVGVPFTSNRFDFDWELVAKLVRLGNVPLEVPITYRSRDFKSGKKVRFFRDPLTWIAALAKFRFTKLTAADGDPAIAVRELPSPVDPLLPRPPTGEATGIAAMVPDGSGGHGRPSAEALAEQECMVAPTSLPVESRSDPV